MAQTNLKVKKELFPASVEPGLFFSVQRILVAAPQCVTQQGLAIVVLVSESFLAKYYTGPLYVILVWSVWSPLSCCLSKRLALAEYFSPVQAVCVKLNTINVLKSG